MSQAEAVVGEALPGRRRRRRVFGAVGAFLLLWAVAAATMGAMAYRDLDAARDRFDMAIRQLRDDDLAAAQDSLGEGAARAGSASDHLERAFLSPFQGLPLVGDDLRTAIVLSGAARDVGAASADLVALGREVLERDGPVELGRAALDDVETLAPALRELSEVLATTSEEVRAAPHGQLLDPIERARGEFLAIADPTLEDVQLATDLAEVLPSVLGATKPMAYLVGAASLSELRASGGLIGSWSLLVADQGELRFDDFNPIDALDPQESDAPAPSPDYAERYERFGALREWRNTNLTPDFPSAARVMLDLWELQGGDPLDGVIMTDTVTFQRMVELSGPMEVPGLVTLTAENTLDFVGVEAYAAFEDQAERKEVLGGVATAAFERMIAVLDGDGLRSTLAMFDELAQGGHLQVFARDERAQSVLKRAGVAGEIPGIGGEFLGVFANNFAANKVDYFAERQLEHHVVLQPNGRARARLEITLTNNAPTEGYPRYVLGPWTDITEAGDNLSFVSIFCGLRCAFVDVPDGAQDGGTEVGRPVVDTTVLVRAGAQRRLTFSTETPDAWEVDGGEVVSTVHHYVQSTLRGSHLRIVLPLPAGWEPSELPDGAVLVDRDVVYEDTSARGLVELTVRLAPSGEDRDALRE